MNDDTRSWAHTVAATAGSAADKARAVVPETYDRAAQAATYVSESIRQYPVAGSAVGALLGYGLGFLLHRQWSSMDPARYSRGSDGRSWIGTASDMAHSAANRARSTAPETYDCAAQAASYVGGSIRQYPVAGSAVGALLGYGLGFLLHRQWSSMDPARYSRGGDGRSWTGTASEIAHSAADRARSTAPETYDRAAQVKDYVGGSITQHVLADAVIVALLGCALVFLAKR
jgi:ElaB/YqjD/DUF883 family membrane-anchored ribosome-binding protein